MLMVISEDVPNRAIRLAKQFWSRFRLRRLRSIFPRKPETDSEICTLGARPFPDSQLRIAFGLSKLSKVTDPPFAGTRICKPDSQPAGP
jgi:hypothetical protein